MKKIFFFVLLVCSYSLFAQTGVGWQQIRYKPNFLDSANFAKKFKVGGVLVDVNATEFNILNGALPTTPELNRLVGVTSSIQTQLNAKLNILDTINMLSKYARLNNPHFTGRLFVDSDTVATRAYARAVGGGGGGAAGVWGTITGTIGDQTDLVNLFSGKISTTHVVNAITATNITNWNTAYSWGNHALGGYVPTTRTVNGRALSSNISITATDVGLGNVNNTSDANKPVSTAQQTALNLKQNTADTLSGAGHVTTDHRTDLIELDLNTYSTLPAATTSGNLLTADGTNWISAAPSITGGTVSGDNVLLYTYDLFVGDAGAPADGDTSWTQTNFVENRLSIWRAGYRQHRNPTGSLQTTHNGFRFQKATGEVIFKPSLETGENLIVEVYDSTSVTETEPPVTSTLLDGLMTYYKFEEAVVGTLDDAVNNKDITTNATVNQTGKIGKAIHPGWNKYIGSGTHDATTTLNHSTWTVKLWVKLDSLPGGAGGTGRPYTLFTTIHNPGSPYWNAILRLETDNRLRIRTKNNMETVITSYGDTLSKVNHWYHIVVRFRGNGYATQIFKAGAEVTEAGADVFTGTLYQVNGGEFWGGGSDEDKTTWTSGSFDEPATWNRALTNGEILESFTKESAGTSYPY